MNLPKIGENRMKIALVIAAGYPLTLVIWGVLLFLGKTADVGNIMTGLTVPLLGVLAVRDNEKGDDA